MAYGSNTNRRTYKKRDPSAKKRKKVCRFCEDGIKYIDFKDERTLRRFTTERGKMVPRRTSGNCAKHQRALTRSIKRARYMAIMGFVTESFR